MTKSHVTPDSPISVELIKYNHHPGARPTVVITWPSHATECTPAKFAQVVSDACRILGSLNRASAPSHRAGTAMINSRHTL
jgi:hypothetical protein